MSDDAEDDQKQQTADAAAAADGSAAPSSRPRRSAAAHAQLKLMQQAFESERPPASSQTAATNGLQTGAAAAALAAPTATPAAAAAATAAAAPEVPRRRGRPPKQNGPHSAAAAAPTAKRAVTGKRARPARSLRSESESDEAEAAAVAATELRARKARDGTSGGRGRGSAAKPPPHKKARGGRQAEAQRGEEEEEEEEEEDKEDRGAARSARRAGSRRGRGAAVAMQSDEEADSDSDEDGKSSSDSSESEQSEEEDEEEEEEEEAERSEEEEEEEDEPTESSDQEEEEDETEAWLPGGESARSMAAAKRSARRKAAKAKAESKAKPKSAASKSEAAAAAASASPKGPATAPSLMDLLDIDDEKAHVDVMRLVLESDSDESLAALLCSRSSKDGQIKHWQRQAHGLSSTFSADLDDLCLTAFFLPGSTFLQRFHRVHCAFHTPGFADHRPRLLRLIELHGTFHASARNDAGQTLLHTICSPATYLRIYLRKRHSRHYPDLPDSWSTSHNRAHSFTDGLLELLIRRGADFQQPDEKGAIPMLELIKTSRQGLVDVSLMAEEVLFPPVKAKAKFKGGVRMAPFDLSLTDSSGSSALMLICSEGEWKHKPKMWTIVQMLKGNASGLKDADLFASDENGQCVLSLLAHAASQLKQPTSQYSWESTLNKQRKKLPQQLLQAWQTARSPALRKELDAWMIPVLAEICCEYLMGPTQKDGVEMSKQEQRRVFGVRRVLQAQADTDLRVKREDDSDAKSCGQASAATSAVVKFSVSSAKVIIPSLFRQAARPLLIGGRRSPAESATPTPAAEGEGEGEQLDGDGDGMDGAEVEVMMASDEENAEPAEAAAPAEEEDDGPTDMEF